MLVDGVGDSSLLVRPSLRTRDIAQNHLVDFHQISNAGVAHFIANLGQCLARTFVGIVDLTIDFKKIV